MAAQIADLKIEMLKDLQLEQQVLVLHWCTKIYHRLQDVKTLTTTCLSKVKDLEDQITSKPF